MNETRLFTFLLESNFDEFKVAIENEVISLHYRFEGNGSGLLFINELSEEKMRFLLDKGIYANSVNYEGENPLFAHEKPELVKLLIEYGADVSHTCYSYYLPIMSNHGIEKKRLLLEAGSKINSKVRSRTAFDFVHSIEEFALLMQYEQKEVKSFLKGQYEMEPYLYYDMSIIDYMFESKILNKEILNQSCYHGLASKSTGNKEKIIYLYEKGMDIDEKFMEILLQSDRDLHDFVNVYIEKKKLEEKLSNNKMLSNVIKRL